MTTVSSPTPSRVSAPPPTGWLLLAVHAAAAGFGALLSSVAVFTQTVPATAPRSVLIGAGAVVFLGAVWTYAQAHSKVVAADEARFLTWLGRHGPDFQAALALMHDFAGSLPPNLAGDVNDARQTANAAIRLAQQTQRSVASTSVDAVAAQVTQAVLARLGSAVTPPAAPAPPAPAPPAPEPSTVG